MRWLSRLSDLAATRLALIFGFNLTIWVFFTIPLVAELLPTAVQVKVFYYASGWVQLFALPLMVYVTNKVQSSSDKQDAVQEELLREIRKLSEQNHSLNLQIRQLVNDEDEQTPPPGSDIA